MGPREILPTVREWREQLERIEKALVIHAETEQIAREAAVRKEREMAEVLALRTEKAALEKEIGDLRKRMAADSVQNGAKKESMSRELSDLAAAIKARTAEYDEAFQKIKGLKRQFRALLEAE
jgi:cell division protein FtsL